MHVVLSIGGSSILGDGKPDMAFLKSMAQVIKKSKNSFGILTGGGSVARLYANAARKLGASEYDADSIAITSTKQNAQLMIAALSGAGMIPKEWSDYDDLERDHLKDIFQTEFDIADDKVESFIEKCFAWILSTQALVEEGQGIF